MRHAHHHHSTYAQAPRDYKSRSSGSREEPRTVEKKGFQMAPLSLSAHIRTIYNIRFSTKCQTKDQRTSTALGLGTTCDRVVHYFKKPN